MTEVHNKAYSWWSGVKRRVGSLPRPVKWLFMAAFLIFIYVLPTRSFYEYLGLGVPGSSFYLPLYTTGADFTTILFDAAVFVLLAVGLNVVVGFAGLLDLGYFGFFAVGAYTVALLTSPASKLLTDYHWLKSPWPWLAALPVAVAVTMAVGVLLGWPTLRLRGDYLAIVTLGFAEMIRIFAVQQEGPLNGDRGISSVPHPPGTWPDSPVVDSVFGPDLAGNPLFSVRDLRPYYWLTITAIILVVLGVRNLARSRVGRAWVAIREDEDAAELMGVQTFKYKLWAFAIGAAVGGLSGAIWAGKVTFINSGSFSLQDSILVLAAVILGGAGNIGGAILGGFTVIYLPAWLRGLGENLGVEIDTNKYRILVFGLVLIVMMIFRPQGIWPNRRRAAEFKDRRKEVAVSE